MDYYDKKQFLAVVDKNDNVIDRIEKWEAHKKAVLHRAFTVALKYKNQYILQHRKHPVFDGVFDLSGSSHPVFVGDKLQTNEEAVINMLRREWNIRIDDFSSSIKHMGNIYYKAKDPNTEYTEHEICHLYLASVNNLPQPQSHFSYGMTLLSKEKLLDRNLPMYTSYAPWVFPLLKLL